MHQHGWQRNLQLGNLGYLHSLCPDDGVRHLLGQLTGDSCHLTQGRESSRCPEDTGQNPDLLSIFSNELDNDIKGSQRERIKACQNEDLSSG